MIGMRAEICRLAAIPSIKTSEKLQVFNPAFQRALRSVTVSLRGNCVPDQYVTDAIGNAIDDERDNIIATYASRVQCLADGLRVATLRQGYLPGLDDRPNGQPKQRPAKRTATARMATAPTVHEPAMFSGLDEWPSNGPVS